MNVPNFPLAAFDWAEVPAQDHPGTTGKAVSRTRAFGEIRVRMVEYTPGYEADHWCSKGHVILCVEGEFQVKLKGGRSFVLRPGMSCLVGDGGEPHGSATRTGARLFIVD